MVVWKSMGKAHSIHWWIYPLSGDSHRLWGWSPFSDTPKTIILSSIQWINLVGGLVAIFDFCIFWVANHPNWRSHIFSEGWRKTTNQQWINDMSMIMPMDLLTMVWFADIPGCCILPIWAKAAAWVMSSWSLSDLCDLLPLITLDISNNCSPVTGLNYMWCSACSQLLIFQPKYCI